MVLVKKCTFFVNLFLVEIRLEIMFNNVLDRKQTFFGHKKFIFFKVLKNRIFPKWLTHTFGQKMHFFINLFSVKIRVEIMFNNVLDK